MRCSLLSISRPCIYAFVIWYMVSLGMWPRSQLQILITCSLQKWRGKAWEVLSHAWWCDIITRDSAWWRISSPFLCYLVQELETITFERQCQYSMHGRFKAYHTEFFWSKNYQALPTLPCHSPLTWCHCMSKSPSPSLSVFAYCKWSKPGTEEGLGMSSTPKRKCASETKCI